MPSSFRKESREHNRRKGNNVLAGAVASSLDQFLEDLRRDEGVSADWVAEYVLGLIGAAVSQYRSGTVERDLPHWAVLKLTALLKRLDLLRTTLVPIGVNVVWKDREHLVHTPEDLSTLMGLLALDEGKVMQAFLAAMSEDGPELTHHQRELVAPLVYHLRRVADDLDDRLSNAGLPDLEEAR